MLRCNYLRSGILSTRSIVAVCNQVDHEKAAKWFLRGAELGNAGAQLHLALAYEHGTGVGKKDIKAAVKWFTLSAQQGNANACSYLGQCYEHGRGVPGGKSDFKKAVVLYQMAAAKGHSAGEFTKPGRNYGLQ